jgi:hypothetical protein
MATARTAENHLDLKHFDFGPLAAIIAGDAGFFTFTQFDDPANADCHPCRRRRWRCLKCTAER